MSEILSSSNNETLANPMVKYIADLMKEHGLGINELTDHIMDDSEHVNPDVFSNIMIVSSPEPLSFLRHILDKKSLNNLGSDGKVYMQTTEELKDITERYQEILGQYDIKVEIINSGPLARIKAMGSIAIKNLVSIVNETFQIGNTSGNPALRTFMKNIAAQKGASVVEFDTDSNNINCTYGNSSLIENNELDVDWMKIGGLNGVLPMYGIKLCEGSKKSDGRFTDYNTTNVEPNNIEKRLQEVVRSSDVELAGFGIKILPNNLKGREKEVDAMCIHNGRLIAIEAKGVVLHEDTGSYDNMQKNLQDLIDQLSIYETKSGFINKVGVLPESPADMIATIKDRTKRFAINEELNRLKDLKIQIIGINELASYLSNN